MVDKIPPEGFVFVNVDITTKGVEDKEILIQKGCIFENNGGKYLVDNEGRLNVFDKNTQQWKDASNIKMTNYQWNAFRAIANNKIEPYNYKTLSKKDIELAEKHYANSNFRNDMGEFLTDGYVVGKASRDPASDKYSVSIDIKRNDSVKATLTFKVAEVAELKAASARFQSQQNNSASNRPTTPSVSDSTSTTPAPASQSADAYLENENSSQLNCMMSRLPYEENKNIKCNIAGVKTLDFTYEVQQGEGYYKIASRFGVDAKALMAYNGETSSNPQLQLNQKIKIPKVVYEVQKGDTLHGISKKFGVEEDVLAAQSGIEDINQIKIGQKITLPADVYTVKKGDNLNTIAKNAGIDVNTLMKANGLSSTVIQPGQQLVIFYNRADYNISEDKKTKVVDNTTNEVVETTDYSSQDPSLSSRPYIKSVKRVNGRVVPNETILKPTGSGDLNGKTIMVNAGHGYNASGGKDGGTPGLKGLNDEWIINYDNSMRLADQLRARGAKVIFIQGQSTLVAKHLRRNKSKYSEVDMFISVHVNAFDEKKHKKDIKDRTQFFYRNSGISSAVKSDSIDMCRALEKTMDSWIPRNEKITDPFYDEKTGKQDYAQVSVNDARTNILETAGQTLGVPCVLWEVAYMTEAQGRTRLSNENLMGDYCEQVAETIENTLPGLDKNKYTVKSGDSLGKIAQKYGTTVAKLQQANGLGNSTSIRVGQVLRIPTS